MIFHNSYKSQKIKVKMLKRKRFNSPSLWAGYSKNATKIVYVNKYLLEHDSQDISVQNTLTENNSRISSIPNELRPFHYNKYPFFPYKLQYNKPFGFRRSQGALNKLSDFHSFKKELLNHALKL